VPNKSMASLNLSKQGGTRMGASGEEAERLCRRCKSYFSPSQNTAQSCRFHKLPFVCRWHDDQKRYYELGPDEPAYAAKFYDCCNAEDIEAPGCTTSRHQTYDDPDDTESASPVESSADAA
jgi:hypothetical protein